MKKIRIYIILLTAIIVVIGIAIGLGTIVRKQGKQEVKIEQRPKKETIDSKIKTPRAKDTEKKSLSKPRKPKKPIPPAQRKISRTERDGEIIRTVDFELQDINGRKFRLSDYSGNIIILNFFATWCPPCRTEMPDFNQITREYATDVTIIAINVGNEPLSKVKDFVKENGLRFIVALDDGYVSRLYGPIKAIPVTYIIDRNFNIAKKYIGARSKEIFVRDIEDLR